MDFVYKLKETLISVLPIIAVVTLLHFTIAPLGDAFLPFIKSGVLLIVGLALFLSGADIGMTSVGEKLGSVLAHSRNVPLILGIGFAIGFGVTFAEPDVNVLATQVHSIIPFLNERVFVLAIALGLATFVDIGLYRILKQYSLKWVLLIFYLSVLLLLPKIGEKMSSIAFDSSGATTGPLAVPFLLAIGLGVSSASKTKENSSFGFTGIASIGPLFAVTIMIFLTLKNSGSLANLSAMQEIVEDSANLGPLFFHMVKKTAIGFGPLVALIFVFQFTLIRFPRVKFRKICLGLIYSFMGIVLFLTGVEFGFKQVGFILGKTLGQNYSSPVIIVVALIFGAVIVCAEPAVWILTKQVEEVSAGRIKRSLVMVFLCVGVASAVVCAVLRNLFNISFLWFAYIGVGISLLLSFLCPPLFVGVAFDSGGVASGPMSTTFLLSFSMGLSSTPDAGFGLVGLIAISPLISIQILGVIFSMKEKLAKLPS